MDKSKIAGLKQRAQIVQNANTEGENTAERVGSLLYDMIDYDRAQSDAITEVENRINNLPTSGVQRVDVQQIVKQGNGTPIANVVVDGTSKTIYAPAGGGPGEKTIVSVSNTLSNGKTIGVVHVDNAEYTLKAPETGGSNVEVTPEYNSGTKIATITVDGEDNAIYVPNEITPTPGGGVQEVSYNNLVENGNPIGVLTVDGEDTTLYAPKGGGGEDQEPGFQATYFANVPAGVEPTTPTANDYRSSSDTFNSTYTWTKVNTNPIQGEDTWMLIVWFNKGIRTSGNINSISKVKIYDSAAQGSNGEDANEIEWIYKLMESGWDQSTLDDIGDDLAECKTGGTWKSSYNPQGGKTWANEDAVPGGWTDNPQGISQNSKYEYAAFRVSSIDEEGKRYWGKTGFSEPILWAKWGDKGIDGDGVEYIFCVDNDGSFLGDTDPSGWDPDSTTPGKNGKTFQQKEYLGPADENNTWTDDPIDLDNEEEGTKEWVSIRRFDGTENKWQAFSAPALWTFKPYNGVANGHIIDFDNENMPVGTDENGNVPSYTNSATIQVFHNGHAMTCVSLVDKNSMSGNSFCYEIGTITRSDAPNTPASGFIASKHGDTSAVIDVSISNITAFGSKTATIPITVYVPGDDGPEAHVKNISLFGVAVGEAGMTLDLYVSSSSVQTDYYRQNVYPTELNVGARIGIGDNVSLYSLDDTTQAAYLQNKNISFRYKYTKIIGNSISFIPATGYYTLSGSSDSNKIKLISGGDIDYMYVTVEMLFGGKVVDAESIHYIRQGAPGIGINAITYGINILSNSLIVDQDTNKVSGSLSFNITRRGANEDRAVEYFTNYGNNAYWLDSEVDSETAPSAEDKDTVVAKDPVIHINGSTIAPPYLGGKTTFEVSISNADLNTTNPFASIILQTNTSMLLASVVVPFAFKGLRGDSSQVQALTSIVTRFRKWETLTTDGMGDIGIGKVPSTGGVVNQDIILYNGEYYYLPESYPDPLSPSAVKGKPAPGTPNDRSWQHIEAMGDAAFQQLIARNGYFDNLTAKDIVVVDTNDGYKPVAGMTSGTSVKVTDNNGTERTSSIAGRNNEGNVRIWAGFNQQSGNLYNSKFYVTEKGYLHSENADITGSIQATSFDVLKSNNKVSISFTTVDDSLASKSGIINAGLQEGDPVGIIYDADGITPKYFFDFAPVTEGSFSSNPKVTYRISATGATAGGVLVEYGPTYYYVSEDSINPSRIGKYVTTPKSNAPLATSTGDLYEVFRTRTFVEALSEAFSTVECIIFKKIKLDNGDLKYYSNGVLGTNSMVELGDGYVVSYKDYNSNIRAFIGSKYSYHSASAVQRTYAEKQKTARPIVKNSNLITGSSTSDRQFGVVYSPEAGAIELATQNVFTWNAF